MTPPWAWKAAGPVSLRGRTGVHGGLPDPHSRMVSGAGRAVGQCAVRQAQSIGSHR